MFLNQPLGGKCDSLSHEMGVIFPWKKVGIWRDLTRGPIFYHYIPLDTKLEEVSNALNKIKNWTTLNAIVIQINQSTRYNLCRVWGPQLDFKRLLMCNKEFY